MNKPTLLCCNLSGERIQAVRKLAIDHGIIVRVVSPQEYGQSLNCLLGLEAPSEAANAGEGFGKEMLVMANFPSGLVNLFLNAFRQEGIPSVKLKALLTKTNSRWSSTALYDELSKESAAMAQMRAKAQAKKAEEVK